MRNKKSVLTFYQVVMCLGLITALTFPISANANEYPNKLIKMIVPVAPGGPTDVLARTLSDALAAELGQPVVVENRSGAGGVTAYGSVASAAPDGYTLAFVDPAITVHPSLHDSLSYDVEKDLTPISSVVRGVTVLVVRKSLDVNNPVDLVAMARKEPGKLTYGSAGSGTPPQLNAELFKIAQGVDIRHVPYRGAAPALADLMAERIDILFVNVGTARAQIEAGNLKPLAVAGKQRTAKLPNVPTFYEAKLPMPEFDPGTWWGVMGPAKLPADIQDKLTEAVGKALKNPQLLRRFDEMSAEPLPSTSKELGELIASERRKWADVVKKANIKQD